jgi:hypothetical protein
MRQSALIILANVWCVCALPACQPAQSSAPLPALAPHAAGVAGAATAASGPGGATAVSAIAAGSAGDSAAASSGAGGAAPSVPLVGECGGTMCQPGDTCCNLVCGACTAMGACDDATSTKLCLGGVEGAAQLCGTGTKLSCPGAGSCADLATDACDPEAGGVDCEGRCECTATGACLDGFRWNADPAVCACQPLPGPCGMTVCQPGEACCNPGCGACAKFGMTTSCDTRACDASLDGSPACGGTARLRCPGEGSCIDDPSDTCDRAQGGKDCNGLCMCTAMLTCAAGYAFDVSPNVCACKPLP